MTNNRQTGKHRNIFRYLSVFCLLSGFLTLYFLFFPGQCSGYAGIYDFIIALVLFLIIFSILLFRQVLFILNHKRFHAWTFLILLILLFGYGAIPHLIKTGHKGKKLIVAETKGCGCGSVSSLTLWDNNDYMIRMARSEFTCIYSGHYLIHDDTLLLDRNFSRVTDSIYFREYRIDFTDSLLIPVGHGQSARSRSNSLKMKNYSTDFRENITAFRHSYKGISQAVLK